MERFDMASSKSTAAERRAPTPKSPQRLGHLATIRIPLPDLNSPQAELVFRAGGGHAKRVRELLAEGVSPDASVLGTSALMAAAQANQTGCLKILLREGADLEALNGIGRSALLLAAEKDSVASVKLLAEAGADLESRDNHGRSALGMSFKAGAFNTALALVFLGADLDAAAREMVELPPHILALGADGARHYAVAVAMSVLATHDATRQLASGRGGQAKRSAADIAAAVTKSMNALDGAIAATRRARSARESLAASQAQDGAAKKQPATAASPKQSN